MATARFEVKKFDGQNSFSLWRLKMRALLRQQGLFKVLEERSADSPVSSKDDEEKVHNTILLSLSDSVLRAAAEEETAESL